MCDCGDPYCTTCGIQHGNACCPICGEWTFDGGCADPEWCEAQLAHVDPVTQAETAAVAATMNQSTEILNTWEASDE